MVERQQLTFYRREKYKPNRKKFIYTSVKIERGRGEPFILESRQETKKTQPKF